MTGERYRCICADPPWQAVTTSGRRQAGKTSGSTRFYEHTPDPYPKLSVEEIAALPVADLAAERSHLFLWTLDRFVIDGSADRVVRAWGFESMGRLIVWSKRNAGLGFRTCSRRASRRPLPPLPRREARNERSPVERDRRRVRGRRHG